MKNIEIRTKMIEAGMKNYELADLLGITETSLSRKLRKELPEEEKKKILSVIQNFER